MPVNLENIMKMKFGLHVITVKTAANPFFGMVKNKILFHFEINFLLNGVWIQVIEDSFHLQFLC